MIVLIAQHFAKEGNEEAVAAALREMSAYCNSDAEPGCVMYIVNRSTENPRHFLLYEQYVDEAAARLAAPARDDAAGIVICVVGCGVGSDVGRIGHVARVGGHCSGALGAVIGEGRGGAARAEELA